MVTRLFALLSLLAMVALTGCGDSAPPPSTPSSSSGGPAKTDTPKAAPKKASGGAAYDAAKATGTIKGVASFEGTAPKAKEIDISSSADCKAKHTEPMMKEDVLVKDGKVQNAVVYVKSVDGVNPEDKWSFEAPAAEVKIDQVGCRYEPHIVALQVDQPLLITTSDDFPHNIHKLAGENAEFNESQQKAGMKATKKFSNPEFGDKSAKIVCNIHNWMAASLHVFPHPFFAVTKADGTYEFKVPAGEYEVVVWHESDKVAVPAAQKVKVGDAESKEVNFAIKAK
jgi:hypothetical protein